MNLRFCLRTADIDCKERRHPQDVMRELGVSYVGVYNTEDEVRARIEEIIAKQLRAAARPIQ
jgi:hypothetical protein